MKFLFLVCLATLFCYAEETKKEDVTITAIKKYDEMKERKDFKLISSILKEVKKEKKREFSFFITRASYNILQKYFK